MCQRLLALMLVKNKGEPTRVRRVCAFKANYRCTLLCTSGHACPGQFRAQRGAGGSVDNGGATAAAGLRTAAHSDAGLDLDSRLLGLGTRRLLLGSRNLD